MTPPASSGPDFLLLKGLTGNGDSILGKGQEMRGEKTSHWP